MTKAEALQRLKAHPIVVGARLDGHILWACADSGNVIVILSREEWERRVDEHHAGGRQMLPEKRERHRNPTTGDRCDGIGCKHVRINGLGKLTDLVRVLETLNHMQKALRQQECD